MKVITDKAKIEELLTRGVDKIYPSADALREILLSGKRLKLYQGFDPTGDKLHIGHMVGLRKLAEWQKLGHEVIFLIGDFTGMIGDPSGKTEVRKMLSKEVILRNAKNYKKEAERILKFSGSNKARIEHNSKWLGKMSMIKFMEMAGLLSVQQVMKRELFQQREKQGREVYMNEFLYPVMQAYDSVALGIDLEVGGTDQMFNMLMGRKLMRQMKGKEKFVMTTPLIADKAGNKIGKSEGNAITLSDNPEKIYGAVMAFPDEVLAQSFECLTDTPMGEIKKMSTENPMGNKKKLAFEIVAGLHNREKAQRAQTEWEDTFQKREIPENVRELPLKGRPIDVVVASGATASTSVARQLFEDGAVVDLAENKKMTLKDEFKIGNTYRIGKHIFIKIK